MLESVVYEPKRSRQDDRRDHHEDGGVLQLVPRGPTGLLGELDIGLFQIVDKLSHLYF